MQFSVDFFPHRELDVDFEICSELYDCELEAKFEIQIAYTLS